jgi:hypothetical protein
MISRALHLNIFEQPVACPVFFYIAFIRTMLLLKHDQRACNAAAAEMVFNQM